jgi:Transcriptional regulator
MNENDPRVKRTRELIVNAFISLISKKGFDNITVKDITTAATINRATFYAHFTDKYELLDTLIIEKFSEIFSEKIRGKISINENTIRILVLCIYDCIEMVKNICKCGYLSVLPLIEDKIIEELEAIILGLYKKELELNKEQLMHAKLVSGMISTSIYNSVYKWEVHKMSITQETLIEDINSFIFNGIDAFKNKATSLL